MKNVIKELGWKIPYKGLDFFIKSTLDKDGYMTIAFSTDSYYKLVDYTHNIKHFIEAVCAHTKFKKDDFKWVKYCLLSDYFYHRRDFKKELKYAIKACSENKNLTSRHFSINIKKELSNYGIY